MELKEYFRGLKRKRGWTFENIARRLRDILPESTYGYSRPGSWFGNEGIPSKPEVLEALCRLFEITREDVRQHCDAHDRIRYRVFLSVEVSPERVDLLRRLEALSDDDLGTLLQLLEGAKSPR